MVWHEFLIWRAAAASIIVIQRLTKPAMSSDREDDAKERIKKRIDIFIIGRSIHVCPESG